MKSALTPQARREIAEEWDGIKRQNHNTRGGIYPPIIYDFTPPFLFDCRIKSPRRMGIGDQILLMAAIQRVADKVGGQGVTVWYDPDYPGSRAVWELGGLNALPVESTQECPPGNVIPCRHHFFESPISPGHCCLYGESTGIPLDEIFFLWGWHKLFQGVSIRPRLYPPVDAETQGGGIALEYPEGFVTCTPLEVSRMNNDSPPDVWGRLLTATSRGLPILFGCALHENGQLHGMIDAMSLQQPHRILNVPLAVWLALVNRAALNYTGNSAGMWLALASRTKTFLMQGGADNHKHNRMWNFKPSWNCGNIEQKRPEVLLGG